MDAQKTYPRVLIVGESFASISGGGITLSNLFKGWPRERLAVVDHVRFHPNTDVCTQYYHLGSSEWKFVWPVSLVLKNRRKSGEVNIRQNARGADLRGEENESWQREAGIFDGGSTIKKLLAATDRVVGTEAVLRTLRLSPDLTEWIRSFQPDLIYTQLSTLQLISLTDQLARTFHLPYVIHIMDDWPTTLYSDKLLSPYLRRRLAKEFRELLAGASGFFGISEKMCNAYQKRYLCPCLPFHNPLDLDRWPDTLKTDWKAHIPFRIMYRGHLGMGIQESLMDLCDAVWDLHQAGRAVQLEITLTPSCDERTRKAFERPGCVTIQNTIPYREIPVSLASADLLVLAYDFDSRAIDINRYSMPTRTPEFMVSGTPVLIYAPSELAVTEYARREKWAEVVTESNKAKLMQTLTRLMDDENWRKMLGRRARELAVQNHDAAHVREAFRQALVAAANHG